MPTVRGASPSADSASGLELPATTTGGGLEGAEPGSCPRWQVDEGERLDAGGKTLKPLRPRICRPFRPTPLRAPLLFLLSLFLSALSPDSFAHAALARCVGLRVRREERRKRRGGAGPGESFRAKRSGGDHCRTTLRVSYRIECRSK